MTQSVPASPGGSKGPVGEPRNPTQIAIFGLLTCGIYLLYWSYKTFDELKAYNGEGLGGGMGLLLSWLIVGWFMLAGEVKKTYEGDGKESPVQPTVGFWIFVPIVSFFVYPNKVQGALNDFWVSKGATPPA